MVLQEMSRKLLALALAASVIVGCTNRDDFAESRQEHSSLAEEVNSEGRVLRCLSSGDGKCLHYLNRLSGSSVSIDNSMADCAADSYSCGPLVREMAERAAAAYAGFVSGTFSFARPPLPIRTKRPVPDAPLAEFAGMWDFNPYEDRYWFDVCGYLIIEEPYVHVLSTYSHGGAQQSEPQSKLQRRGEGDLIYFMLMLPRPDTRYDPDSRSLWINDNGPFTDGDHVSVGGGVGHRQPDWPGPNVHQRNLWQANSMGPTDYPC